VNISAEEALALLNTWKTEGVVVRAHFSGRRTPEKLQPFAIADLITGHGVLSGYVLRV
jgi:hypothetical protein